jgi:hypothetical protein
MVDVLMAGGYHGFREGNFLPLLRNVHTIIERHFSIFDIGSDQVLASKVDKAHLRSRIDGIFQKTVSDLNPTAPWFDKSGGAEMVYLLPRLLELWPGAVAIYMKRNGVENVASRVRKFPNAPFERHCAEWAAQMSSWRETRIQLPAGSSIEIDQGDMISKAAEVAENLAVFLDLSSEQMVSMQRTLETTRAQETEAGSASRSLTLENVGWSEEQKKVFLKHCAAEMRSFGYLIP